MIIFVHLKIDLLLTECWFIVIKLIWYVIFVSDNLSNNKTPTKVGFDQVIELWSLFLVAFYYIVSLVLPLEVES